KLSPSQPAGKVLPCENLHAACQLQRYLFLLQQPAKGFKLPLIPPCPGGKILSRDIAVSGGRQDPGPGFRRRLRHLQRVLPGGRSVVQSRKDMGMQTDHPAPPVTVTSSTASALWVPSTEVRAYTAV